jgi:hypothetical protein
LDPAGRRIYQSLDIIDVVDNVCCGGVTSNASGFDVSVKMDEMEMWK